MGNTYNEGGRKLVVWSYSYSRPHTFPLSRRFPSRERAAVTFLEHILDSRFPLVDVLAFPYCSL